MRTLLLYIAFLSLQAAAVERGSDYSTKSETCLSANELALAHHINSYRKTMGLEAVELSVSLTKVAQAHVHDVVDYYVDEANCNPHSWSKNGAWKWCCYNSAADGNCMWSKPREITNYTGDGYEIIMMYYDSKSPDMEVSASVALDAWKKSPNHNAIISNTGMWKPIEWQAMGIGIYKSYAAVWFGKEKDPDGSPESCINK